MPSRVIREALVKSDKWLGLAHPVERLAYVVLLLTVDDLGTAEASDGQLIRLWRDPCNVKGREDTQSILQALADADLVRVYTVEGKRYVFVPRFRQRFRARTLRCPCPPENLLHDEPEILENIRQINNRVLEMTVNGLTDVGQLAGNGQTVAPVGVGVGVKNISTPNGVDVRSEAADPPAEPRNGKHHDATPPCPHEQIIELYHEVLPMCPRVREWNETRKGLLRARWKAKPERQDLDWWRRFFGYVAQSKFLTGQAEPRDGKPPFVADLEWLAKPTNFAKVIEGRYHDRVRRVAA